VRKKGAGEGVSSFWKKRIFQRDGEAEVHSGGRRKTEVAEKKNFIRSSEEIPPK